MENDKPIDAAAADGAKSSDNKSASVDGDTSVDTVNSSESSTNSPVDSGADSTVDSSADSASDSSADSAVDSAADSTVDSTVDSSADSASTDSETDSAPADSDAEDELSVARREASENKDLYLRAVADLENTKKRAEEQSRKIGDFVLQNFAAAICEVRDCLESALTNLDSEGKKGVELTLRKLTTTMDMHGITPISPVVGATFDPTLHQAIGVAENSATDEKLDANSVATLVQKGYTLNGRVIRAASVMVTAAQS